MSAKRAADSHESKAYFALVRSKDSQGLRTLASSRPGVHWSGCHSQLSVQDKAWFAQNVGRLS